MKLYEKYLVSEADKRKVAMDKVLKVIKSAKNAEQLDVAAKMAVNFVGMYGMTFMDAIKDTFNNNDDYQTPNNRKFLSLIKKKYKEFQKK